MDACVCYDCPKHCYCSNPSELNEKRATCGHDSEAYSSKTHECTYCDGTGKYGGWPCPMCHGFGKL